MLEHLTFEEQPRALAELHRVLRPGGELLVSVPNLAHLQSRVHFLLRGRLIRTASELKHPGDRPVAEYLAARAARRVRARRATRHLPDRSGPHAAHPPPSARAPAAAPLADAAAAGARLVLPEPADVPAPRPHALTRLCFQKIRELSKNLAIYGLGDVAIQIVNFLLLRVYVQYLSPADYGVLALLGSVEAVTKMFFRWGLDGAFMRFWYDCADDRARQRLASTIFFFLLALNGAAARRRRSPLRPGCRRGSGAPGYTLALRLVLLNTFAIGFTFIPFHVLRMEQRAREFSLLTFARSAATIVLRLVLVVGLGYGVMGVVVADLVVTAVLLTVMVRWFAPLIRPMFSRTCCASRWRSGCRGCRTASRSRSSPSATSSS